MREGVDGRSSNEELALRIIKKYLGPAAYKYRTDDELIIGGTRVSELIKRCYISKNNRGDVMVECGGSDVLYVEVHSGGTYDCTIRKTV